MNINLKQDAFRTASKVPSQPHRLAPFCSKLFLFNSLLILITISGQKATHCQIHNGIRRPIRHVQPQTSSPNFHELRQVPPEMPLDYDERSEADSSSSEPTPPLPSDIIPRQSDELDEANEAQNDFFEPRRHRRPFNISPHRVIRDEIQPGDSFALIPLRSSLLAQQDYQADSSNNFEDLIESGSGADNVDESSLKHDESTILSDHVPSPTQIAPEQLMTPTFQMSPDIFDHAPILARRMPKLSVTAGSTWRYTVPSDTFKDEDGDLRQLKSTLSIRQREVSNKNANNDNNSENSNHWLRYDQRTQTLIGFPVTSDVGKHFYTLTAVDRLGNTANEAIEIVVRPHQSLRAFTHIITMSGIELNVGDSSMIDTLTEIVKRIAEDVYQERSARSVMVHSYSVLRSSTNNSSPSMTLSWSNSSLPINRCDLESVVSSLIEDKYLGSSWSLSSLSGSNLVPSQNLIKALSPEFKPSTMRIDLRGICANIDSDAKNIGHSSKSTTNLRIKNRIGKVRLKLGQPIIFKIPEDVFTIDNDAETLSNMTILLHTIDGLTLDQDKTYSFLEFDQESRTIFGLPFDQAKHGGQRELLLTARHDPSSQVARETFIFDIQPQDLTTINNRAFRLSIYFMARTNVFGPIQQVHLSQRMINALDIRDLNFNNDQTAQEFVIMQIEKFKIESNIDNSALLSDPSNAWRYHDKIQVIDEINSLPGEANPPISSYMNTEGSYFYKLSWTNETIGYRGDCPVEVIKYNILEALERSMIDYVPPNIGLEDPQKNASVRFYERLRAFFEPEVDLIHLRFEPIGACLKAIEYHDAGNSEVADLADQVSGQMPIFEPEVPPLLAKPEEETKTNDVSPINSDEYWAIVVLIVLVVAIIFVVMMLFMGLHTYRINQEKRFELQMKLAQARQNSMYLSSLVLADRARPFDMAAQPSLMPPTTSKSMFVEDRSSRKPAILDNEKQFMTNGHMEMPIQKPTAVQLMGQVVHTTPLKPNTTFTLDSIANLQGLPTSIGPDMMVVNPLFIGNPQRSMTLNRRPLSNQAPILGRKASMTNLSQSQSILTVASLGAQQTIEQQSQPTFYPQMPTFFESQEEPFRV